MITDQHAHLAIAIKIGYILREKGLTQMDIVHTGAFHQSELSKKLLNKIAIQLHELYTFARLLDVDVKALVPSTSEAIKLLMWAQKHKPKALPAELLEDEDF